MTATEKRRREKADIDEKRGVREARRQLAQRKSKSVPTVVSTQGPHPIMPLAMYRTCGVVMRCVLLQARWWIPVAAAACFAHGIEGAPDAMKWQSGDFSANALPVPILPQDHKAVWRRPTNADAIPSRVLLGFVLRIFSVYLQTGKILQSRRSVQSAKIPQ